MVRIRALREEPRNNATEFIHREFFKWLSNGTHHTGRPPRLSSEHNRYQMSHRHLGFLVCI